jgi:hypothetical protein
MNAESPGPIGSERNRDSPDKIQSLRDFEAWGMDDIEQVSAGVYNRTFT